MLAVQHTINSPDNWRWSTLLQAIGEKEDEWEGRRRRGEKAQMCKGRVEGEHPGNDVVLVKDSSELSAQVCTYCSMLFSQ